MSAAYRHCVIGLLTSIVWTLTDRLDDVYITDIVYLLDVLVVIVYMSYCNSWDYLLLHEDWGECSEDGGVQLNVPGVLKRMQKKKKFGGGGDFGGVWGAPRPTRPTRPTRGLRGVGKRYTSSYDHDMWPVKILERCGLAVKSYHPETLAAEEEKKRKKNYDKTIRHFGNHIHHVMTNDSNQKSIKKVSQGCRFSFKFMLKYPSPKWGNPIEKYF